MDTRELVVRLKGDNSDFKQKMNEVSDSTEKGRMSFLKLSGAVAAGQAIFSAATAVIGTTVGIVRDSIHQYEDAEAAQKELQHAVLDVTGATQAQLDATNKLADSLSQKGVLDDDVIRKGLAQLSTFGLTNASVQKLASSMADLTVNQFGVAASGDDAVQAANIMAKALNGNFGALEKMGIHLTEAQKQLIKFGNETQRVNTINAVLAANLRTNQATALETTAGKMAHLSVIVGNLKEALGGLIISAVTPLLTKLNDFVSSDKFQAWVTQTGQVLNKTLPPIANFIANVLIPAFVEVTKTVFDFAQKAFTFLKPSLDALFNTIKTQLWPAIVELWNAIKPVIPVIGVLLVGALWLAINVLNIAIKVISDLIKWVQEAAQWVGLMVGKIGLHFGSIKPMISAALNGIFLAITGPFGAAFEWISHNVDKIVGKLKDLNPFQRHSPSLYDLVKDGTKAISVEYGSMFKDIQGHADTFQKANMSQAISSVVNNSKADNRQTVIHINGVPVSATTGEADPISALVQGLKLAERF